MTQPLRIVARRLVLPEYDLPPTTHTPRRAVNHYAHTIPTALTPTKVLLGSLVALAVTVALSGALLYGTIVLIKAAWN